MPNTTSSEVIRHDGFGDIASNVCVLNFNMLAAFSFDVKFLILTQYFDVTIGFMS